MRRRFNERKFVFFILFGVVALLAFSGIVMLLWNNILAGVVNISTITFFQAMGILLLSKILFGGFRGGWGGSRWNKGRHWNSNMQEKWATMTPEEREKFKEQWQKRCGSWWKDESAVGSQQSGVGSRESEPGSQKSSEF